MEMLLLWTIVFVIHLAAPGSVYGDGPLCYLCSDMSKAHFCDQITRCKDGQICYLEKHLTTLGHEHYSSGCIDRRQCGNGTKYANTINQDHSVKHRRCLECCHDDFCNNKGCGDVGLPSRDLRGPVCFNCNYLSNPAECYLLTVCSKTENCVLLQKNLILFEKQYQMGCKQGCADVTSNLHNSHEENCCSSDFCNSPLKPILPINGNWSVWSAWTQCNSTCGGNTVRQRTCTNPTHSKGRQGCVGNSTEIQDCTPCPVNGNWSVWSAWTQCNNTCGGNSLRQRTCTNPTPTNGGRGCVGNSTEMQDCTPCPVICSPGYTPIAKFSRCYKISTSALSFDNARAQCQREGSDLIMFKSRDELQFFQPLVFATQGRPDCCMYIGSRSNKWLNGSAIAFVLDKNGGLWQTTANNGCGCVYIQQNSWLTDCNCRALIFFICGHLV